jgi:hypothetical protein
VSKAFFHEIEEIDSNTQLGHPTPEGVTICSFGPIDTAILPSLSYPAATLGEINDISFITPY